MINKVWIISKITFVVGRATDSLGESFNYGSRSKGAIAYGEARVGNYRLEASDTTVIFII